MGHVEDRRPQLPADVQDLKLERLAELPIEGPQRLVHEQQLRFEDDGPGEGDALLLTARELARVAIAEPVELDERQRVGDPPRDLGTGSPPHLERKGDVLGGGHVGKQRVVLEHHADITPIWGDASHVAAVDLDRAARRRHEPRDHPEGRRLAGTRWAEERDELAASDLQVNAVDGGGGRGSEQLPETTKDQGGTLPCWAGCR